MGRQSRAAWVVLAFGLVACTDFVYDQAPSGCGFPEGTELDFGSHASAHQLGLDGVPVDPTLVVEAFVTEDHVDLPSGRSRAACLVIPEGDSVEYWVGPVPDGWQYLP